MDRDEILENAPTDALMHMREMVATMLDVCIELPPNVTPIQFFNKQLKMLDGVLMQRLMPDAINADSEDITLSDSEKDAFDSLTAQFDEGDKAA